MHATLPSVHIVGSRLYGGAEHFYVRLLRLLRDAGQPVLAINRTATPVANALAGDGIQQIHLPFANGWDLWSLWRLRKRLGDMDRCIVQTYMGRATRLTRLPAKSPAIHIARLGEYYKIDGYYRHAHAWIGNTQGICDYLVKSGLPASRVYHIGNFVPEPSLPDAASKAGMVKKYAIPDNAWVLFSLGRLVENKGFDDLLTAMTLLPKEIGGKPWVLLIAGDGPYADKLRAFAQSLNLDGQIRWLGWQDNTDVFYSLADVFICPSRHEPLGNVILEAWSHGLPLISTATLGATELVEPGVTGMLCACQDPAALASQINAVLSASDLERQALGDAGRTFLDAHFSPAAIGDAYLSLYAELLSKTAV